MWTIQAAWERCRNITRTLQGRDRPDQGLLKVRMTTLNQHGDAVQVLIGTLMIPRRVPQGT